MRTPRGHGNPKPAGRPGGLAHVSYSAAHRRSYRLSVVSGSGDSVHCGDRCLMFLVFLAHPQNGSGLIPITDSIYAVGPGGLAHVSYFAAHRRSHRLSVSGSGDSVHCGDQFLMFLVFLAHPLNGSGLILITDSIYAVGPGGLAHVSYSAAHRRSYRLSVVSGSGDSVHCGDQCLTFLVFLAHPQNGSGLIPITDSIYAVVPGGLVHVSYSTAHRRSYRLSVVSGSGDSVHCGDLCLIYRVFVAPT
ncbi:hypothetical protein J6590_027367 [Homalodisca vitripennis]|nr:hypothetical protein J6590_027367 [Homalodisca vitripennis]